MFCPKCGTENPEEGRFCRKCGTDLGAVSKAIGSDTHTGMDLMSVDLGDISELGAELEDLGRSRRRRRGHSDDPGDLLANGVKSAITGVGFIVVSIVLFFTGVAGGHAWWWAMLIPGFATLASGLGNIAKARRAERRLEQRSAGVQKAMPASSRKPAIGPAGTDFIPAKNSASFKTGDLVPPSVVEDTTRHLEMDTEGETMTLPDIEGEK